ncbi:hypothetical protein JCM4814A_48420 [Streptomyces phaeofaciens JCM 4814]|uniref:Uncharacterized protein n=1 Tax=Streptomyces phaeofaciens TaxID=68254 RepID=A0A918H2U0_9ACTN|nr:hypothetical protein GCM10010226_05080 [Streptomyces phaeofaciens]
MVIRGPVTPPFRYFGIPQDALEESSDMLFGGRFDARIPADIKTLDIDLHTTSENIGRRVIVGV